MAAEGPSGESVEVEAASSTFQFRNQKSDSGLEAFGRNVNKTLLTGLSEYVNVLTRF